MHEPSLAEHRQKLYRDLEANYLADFLLALAGTDDAAVTSAYNALNHFGFVVGDEYIATALPAETAMRARGLAKVSKDAASAAMWKKLQAAAEEVMEAALARLMAPASQGENAAGKAVSA